MKALSISLQDYSQNIATMTERKQSECRKANDTTNTCGALRQLTNNLINRSANASTSTCVLRFSYWTGECAISPLWGHPGCEVPHMSENQGKSSGRRDPRTGPGDRVFLFVLIVCCTCYLHVVDLFYLLCVVYFSFLLLTSWSCLWAPTVQLQSWALSLSMFDLLSGCATRKLTDQ